MSGHRETDPGNIAMCARMIRSAGRHCAQRDPDQLARLAGLQGVLDAALMVAVRGQRSQGVTWESIGDALGVTKQGAIMAFGPKGRKASSVP